MSAEEEPGGQEQEMLNYRNNVAHHNSNLKAAIDYHSVREPDLELISKEGRRLFGHRAVLGIFSQLLSDMFSYVPLWENSIISLPETSSEVLSHLLNVLYTGSTETSSDKVELLCGAGGVFATAKLLGISIKSDQKVIEVVDRSEGGGQGEDGVAQTTYGVSNMGGSGGPATSSAVTSVHDESLEEDEEEIVLETEDEPETMEITPQIPMFDLGHFLYQGHDNDQQDEEQAIPAPQIQQQQEDQDFYICKLPSCQTMIQFENCGARSKILNHYTSHFQRELEAAYGHLLTSEMECTLCGKQLKNFIKSKIWIHIGVTHDKTNDILIKKGIEPIRVNIRMKRKASDAFRDGEVGVSPPKMTDQVMPGQSVLLPPVPRILEYPSYGQQLQNPGQIKVNTCKLCGQVTQNRKRLLKHYCTRHYIDRLSNMEFSYIEKNRCTICGKDFIGAKKSSKVIHIGLEHKKIYDILDEEFGKDGFLKHDSSTPLAAPPPLKKIRPDPVPQFRPIAPKVEFPSSPVIAPKPITPLTSSVNKSLTMVNPGNIMNSMPRVEATMSERMKEIQDLGNTCHVCGKQFDLFRSMLLPHYCGHFYKEIAQGHEEYFTEVNCKLCGATATKRKSRIIHLGVKHELVLPYIEDVLQSRNLLQKATEEDIEEEEEEMEVGADDNQNEFVIDESELKSENEVHDGTEDEDDEEQDEPEEKVVTPLRIKVPSLRKIKDEEDSGTDVSQDGMTITRIVKDERKETVSKSNKEVWITPAKSKSETVAKWATQQNNIDNQDKPYHLNSMFNDSVVSNEDHDPGDQDVVTADNLGLVCRLCQKVETSDHELLTHYCSHFDEELKDISAKMIDEEHKCVECHKMLGNNKRRLFHFGVKHLKVIPLINQRLRSLTSGEAGLTHSVSISRITKNKKVDESVTDGDDDFEITYDQGPETPALAKGVTVTKRPVPAATPINSSALARTPAAGQLTPVSGHKNPRTCELCGCKRNTSYNLLLHCTKQHFAREIEERWGELMSGDNVCGLCHEQVDITTKNVGEMERWIHLGHKHGKTNTLLKERGKRMIIIKGYNDQDFDLESSAAIGSDDEEDGGTVEITANNVGSESGSEDETSEVVTQSLASVNTEYNCPMCEKTTKNQNLLDLHLIAIHFKKELLSKYGNPENTCTACNKPFQNIDAFAFHIGKDHDLLKEVMEQGLEEDDVNDPQDGGDSSPEAKVTITRTPAPTVASPQLAAAAVPNPGFVCFKCGAKRRGMKELYGHYSLQHFSKELMEEHGVHKKCTFEACTKNLENGTAWVSHLGQEHPEVLDKHIPEQYWQHKSQSAVNNEVANASNEFQCPLNCKKSFSEKSELLSHFKSVHGFSNEIIAKMIKAHPQLNSLSSENTQGKVIEA